MEPDTHLISSDLYSSEKILLAEIDVSLRLDNLRTDFFQTCNDDKYNLSLQLDTRLHDLDHHSGSQLYEKANTPEPIFSDILQPIQMKSIMLQRP